MKRIFLLLAALFAFASPALAQVNTSAPASRPLMTGDFQYSVNKSGSDSNSCLITSSPCLTINGAFAKAAQVDFNGFLGKIKITDTAVVTYNERILVPAMTGQKIPESLVLEGNLTTPTNITIQNTGNFQPAIECNVGCRISLGGGFTITAPNNGFDINAAEGGTINVNGNINFGPAGSYHAYANNSGVINFFQPYSITGAALAHWVAGLNGAIYSATTINGGGNALAFPYAFAAVINGGVMAVNGNTFTNTASFTGKRYQAESNGSIQTYGAGATYLPGSVAGTVATGGVYQ